MPELKCPYCTQPQLFESPKGEPIRDGHASIASKGKYWKALRPRFGKFRIRSFHESIYPKPKQHRYRIEGKEHFKARFDKFDVDVIGVEHRGLAPVGPLPFFHRSGPPEGPHVPNEQKNICLIYNGCRITTERVPSLIIDAHWWFSHGMIFNINNLYPHMEDSILIAQEALEFFREETRGRPKIKPKALVNEITVIEALRKTGTDAPQAVVAKELGVSDRTLRTFLRNFNLTWDEAIRRYSRIAQMRK